jgi:RNA polymerase subunit RPABC4/transcription elongation factor Spt4
MDIETLRQIERLVSQGDRVQAYDVIVAVIEADSSDVQAWLWLSELTPNTKGKSLALKQALSLDPGNLAAKKTLSLLPPESTEQMTSSSSESIHSSGYDTLYAPTSNGEYSAKISPRQHPVGETDGSKIARYLILALCAVIAIGFIALMVQSGSSFGDVMGRIGEALLCLISIFVGVAIIFGVSASSKARASAVDQAIRSQDAYPGRSPMSQAQHSHPSMIACRVCDHPVSRTAPACPNCGELFPGLIAGCPFCHSKNITIRVKGFSGGKAAAGAVLAGPLGLAAGLHGRGDLEVRCSSCSRWTMIKTSEIA